MVQSLPKSGFHFVDVESHKDEVLNADENSENGFIVEVDLEYPEELHDLHNDYPLAPERVSVGNDM